MNVNLNYKRCAKMVIVAIIGNEGKFWIGTNWCENSQKICPRGDMPSGEGYNLCKEVCKQTGHAEENALLAAGEGARGGILYLIGHTYCCQNCKKLMAEAGIRSTVIYNKDLQEFINNL